MHSKKTLEAVGTLSLRAPVGDRPRRLQRRWHGLGILSARSRSLARLSLGGGRNRRDLRPAPDHVLCAGLLEWTRSHPERTSLRPHRNQGNHGEDVKEYYFYLD